MTSPCGRPVLPRRAGLHTVARWAVGWVLAGTLAWSGIVHAQEVDPTVTSDDELPEGVTPIEAPEDERAARRAQRKALRAARWTGPALPKEADFLRTETEITFRLGFNGTAPGVFSLFTALAGWNELGIGVEGGVATWRDFTIALGVEGHYGGAWVPAALTQPVSDTERVRFRWSAWEAGGALRVAFHYTRLFSVDPWVGGALGASAFQLRVRVAEPEGPEPQSFILPTFRAELAGGINVPLERGLVVGVELRYLITSLLTRVERLRFGLPDDTVETFVLYPQHRPPKGFSWVVRVGYRF